jgi:hypothetical protein
VRPESGGGQVKSRLRCGGESTSAFPPPITCKIIPYHVTSPLPDFTCCAKAKHPDAQLYTSQSSPVHLSQDKPCTHTRARKPCRPPTTNAKRRARPSIFCMRFRHYWYTHPHSTIEKQRPSILMPVEQNTQLDRYSLSYCVSLIENGVHPEALAVCSR